MQININIDDYLSEYEKKQLCIDYVKETLRGNTNNRERILSNMAYHAAFAILDSALTPEMLETIRKNVARQVTSVSDFGIFRKKNAWEQEDSPAYCEVQKAVSEHKHLINSLVKKAIIERDYLKDLPKLSDYIAEVIIDLLSKGLKNT